MLLSTGIAEAPGSDVGEVDYEAYADLEVPPLNPEEALERFEIEEGFRIEMVAHEPMVTGAMDVDADGCLWRGRYAVVYAGRRHGRFVRTSLRIGLALEDRGD